MTFCEEVQEITRVAEERKKRACIEASKAIILDSNKEIRGHAESGYHMCFLYYGKDCDVDYILKYYGNEGFRVTSDAREKRIMISW